MNFAEIQNLWHVPQNRPSASHLEEIKMKFVADLNKRHRGIVVFLSVVGIALIFITGKILLHLIWPAPGAEPIDVAREWSIVPFFALPWIGWLVMVAQYRRHRTQHPNYDRSIPASVRALLDENRMERTRYKIISALQALTVLLLPLVVWQLRQVGKAGDEILVPAFVVAPLLIAGIFLFSTFRYRRTLLPRKRELEGLLAAYE